MLPLAAYYYGKDWVDISDGSVTREHVRKWRILQDLKVSSQNLIKPETLASICDAHLRPKP